MKFKKWKLLILTMVLIGLVAIGGCLGGAEYEPDISTSFSDNHISIYNGEESKPIRYTITKNDNENIDTTFEVKIEPANPEHVQVFLQGIEEYSYTTERMKYKESEYPKSFTVKGDILGNTSEYNHKVNFKVYWNNTLQKEDSFIFQVKI